MGIKERRDSEKAELKEKIMGAAIEIINHEGYENLSIRKIAAKIEYSPTTIYLYYKDKAQIIKDMSDELYYRIEKKAVSIMKQKDSVSTDKKIHDILCCFVKNLSNEPEMVKVIMYSGMNEIFASENKDPYPTNDGNNMLEQLLAQGIAEKLVKPSIRNTSWMIISALIGFAMCVVENKIYALENYDQIVEGFVEILMGGIRR